MYTELMQIKEDAKTMELWYQGTVVTLTDSKDIRWIKKVMHKGKRMGLEGEQLMHFLQYEMDESCFYGTHSYVYE